MDQMAPQRSRNRRFHEPIVIAGIGARFPQAPGVEAFWNLLWEGRSGIREMPAADFRWDEAGLYESTNGKAPKITTRRGGFLDDLDLFDWKAFRILPREAARMDPQHRLLLEVAWEALEDAGLPLQSVAGTRTGVFVGITWNDFLRRQSTELNRLDGYCASGNGFAFASNRISFAFDLRGPSLSVDVACVSSLATIHMACQSLLSGESDLALAGGVELLLSPDSSVMMSQAGILSPEGCVRPLDAKADGFVRGEGAGLIVLKRLSDVKPSDRVYAVIQGSALNHKGTNEWFMAPRQEAQSSAVREALEAAGKSGADLDYIELNGTGFLEGDRAECLALGEVVRDKRDASNPCAIGALKPSIGNLGAAGGISSVIKVALSLHHRTLPPTLNLTELNPSIPFDELRLRPQTERMTWPEREGRLPLAGVHGTSLSGSNAHLIMEGVEAAREKSSAEEKPRLFVLSAKSETALATAKKNFVQFLEEAGSAHSLRDLCYSGAMRRTRHEFRFAAVVSTVKELGEALLGSSKRYGSDDTISEMARSFLEGRVVDFSPLFPESENARLVSLPAYPWQRERCWPEWLKPRRAESVSAERPAQIAPVKTASASPKTIRVFLETRLKELLQLAPARAIDPERSFRELGLDSVMAVTLRNDLNETFGWHLHPAVLFEYPNLTLLSRFLEEQGTSPVVQKSGGRPETPSAPPELTQLSVAELNQLLDDQTSALNELLDKVEA
jgi:3-oxoacyl-[acyl-carrier-protein] synthase II